MVKYLTTAQAAEALSLSKSTLDNWRSQGRGPSYIKVGGAVRYRIADIESWVESQQVVTIDQGKNHAA